MPETSPTPVAEAVPPARRSLAPDLARGVMLLVIAAAHGRIMAEMFGGGHTESTLDSITELLLPMLVDGRGYPMFAALFGYGLCQIYLRRQAQHWQWPAIRSLVRRRGRWLFGFGLAHVVLLFFGDILSIYGLVALAFAAVLRFSDARLLRHAALWLVVGSGVYAVMLTQATLTSGDDSVMGTGPIADTFARLLSWPVFTPFMFVTTVFPFLIGVWAARRRVLEEPSRHLPLLRKVAYIGVPVGIAGGLPLGLHNMGAWHESGFAAVYGVEWLSIVTGYLGGLGYAALIGLIAARLASRPGGAAAEAGPAATGPGRTVAGAGQATAKPDRVASRPGGATAEAGQATTRPGRIVSALAATGQRSMTSYLLQSVAWMLLFPPYLLGLGPKLSAANAVAVGAAVWLATVLIAEVMRRNGWRGPAERALRARTYRSRAAKPPARPARTGALG